MFGARFEDLHRGGWDPDARLADQDRDGVAAEVIYPTVGMMLCNHPDFDYKQACFDAYNRWIAEYCVGASGSAARRRARPRCARSRRASRTSQSIKALGLRGVMMPGNPARRRLRRPDLRPVLGGRGRPRPAAVVPHPDQPARHAQARAGRSSTLPVDHPRLPGHHRHVHARRRVRAPPEAQARVRRGRRRLGAPLHVPHGPRLRAAPLLAAGGRRSRGCPASTSASTSTPRSRTTGWRSR